MTGAGADSVATRAFGWRLERRDGVTLAFTSHDRDVEQDGVRFAARPGLVPSRVRLALGLEDDAFDLAGALTDEAITERDLDAGRWDGATVRLYRLDWEEAGATPRLLAAGELGELMRSGAAFRAEVRGAAALLDGPVAPQTSPGCRASFGDAACGVARARYRHEAMAVAVDDVRLELASLPVAAERFALGRLRWLSGPVTGLVQPILASDGDALILADPPPLAPALPGRVELLEGCDKTLATCADRFANAVNFRGEPYLPGNDLLTRYPGAA